MFVEIDAVSATDSEIIRALYELNNSEQPLVIRNGVEKGGLDFWHQYLKKDVGLVEDRRHFGYASERVDADWWEISYQPEKADSYAYSRTPQPLHNDNAWFADAADLNFFFMQLQASAGGEQTIYPVSSLLDDLSAQDPQLLSELRSTRVVINKGDSDVPNNTTILTTKNGRERVYWNYYRTEKPNKQIVDLTERFFNFLKEQSENSSSVTKVRLDSGDCLAFNDSLLLHGRTAFVADEEFGRVLYQSMWNFP